MNSPTQRVKSLTMVLLALALASPALIHAQTPAASPAQLDHLPLDSPDPYPTKKKILIVADVQSGYHHDGINHAMTMVSKIAYDSGLFVAYIRTDSQLITKSKIKVSSSRYDKLGNNARNLDFFDAIFFIGSGEGTLSEQQKADLLSFVRDDGKGIILGHAATIQFYNWPEWGNMIGGFMQNGEYPTTGLNAITVDMKWPGAAAFGKSFFWADQFPRMKPDMVKGSVHTIMTLDTAKMTPAQLAFRTDGYFPIVWSKYYGKGRVFSVTAGHNDDTYDDPKMQALLLNGMKWATGLIDADATPDRK